VAIIARLDGVVKWQRVEQSEYFSTGNDVRGQNIEYTYPMFKKLLFALSLLCLPPLFAQSTKVVPDCVIPFNFTATGSTSNLTCGAPNASPNSPGIASWLLVYESTGYSVLSLVVQSAPDNNGSPGTWGTFAGTVLSSTALPGSSGINPNTAITSAFTGFAGYYPWMRVTLSSVTGTGRVKGNLYGYLNSTIAKAGAGGSGTVTACGGATAGQVTVFSSPTAICGIVQSAFDAAATNALVRFGPLRSALPAFTTNFMGPTNLEATSSSAAHAAFQAGALGTAGIFAASSPTLSYGIQINSTSTGAGNAYAIAQTIGSTNSAHSLDLYGQFVQSNMDPSTSANNMWYYYGVQPFLDSTATIGTFVTFYQEDLRTGRAGTITNPYYSWFDARGVGRCRDDNTFNSVGQVICAVYNPQFTKYVAGAANYERIIYGQWSSNVAQIGVEKGGTGTLRDLQLIGNRILGATAAPGTNTTELATTAFVAAAIAASGGGITGLTPGTIPKAASATSIVDSSCTVDVSGVLSCPGFTGTAANSSAVGFLGFTSGQSWLAARDAAGTAITYYLPTTNGTANQVLVDNGAVTCDANLPADAPAVCHQLVFTSSPTISGANITGLPVSTGISGFGSGVAAALAASVSGTGGICLTSGSSCGGGGSGAAGSTLFSTTGSTTVTATSPTTLIGAATGSTTVPLNTFTAGQVLEFVAQGFYSTPATPASLTIALSVGGTNRITTGAVVQIASVTNGVWRVRCMVTTRTAGASGTQIANCIWEGTGISLTPGESPMQTSSTWTIDTTATQAIDLLATWSTTTGAPTITSTNVAAWIPGAPVTSVAGLTGAVAGQGTDTKVMTAGTVAGTGATLCTDANGGATTSGCSSGGFGPVAAPSYVTTAQTTTSLCGTAFVDLATPDSVTFTLASTTNITAEFLYTFSTNQNGAEVQNQFNVDGSLVSATLTKCDQNNANFITACKSNYFGSLAAGSHTIKVQHCIFAAGTETAQLRWLLVSSTP